jgi:hypothetical protein
VPTRFGSQLLLYLVVCSFPATASGQTCPGACLGGEQVTVEDLTLAVNVALGMLPHSECPGSDLDEDGMTTVDEILAAVDSALNGCSTLNLPPVVPDQRVYRTYPGYEIELPTYAVDPEGDMVHCEATELPEGAAFDPEEGALAWTPSDEQIGAFYVPFTCMDQGDPPKSTDGVLTVKVRPPDVCTDPTCDATAGCSVSLPPASDLCCEASPALRVAEPSADCPEGQVLFVGRNETGFGEMQNCDTMRVVNFAQLGATAIFHVRARCIDFSESVLVHARMETAERGVVFDLTRAADLDEAEDGFADARFVDFPIDNPPYFDLQDAEANLHVAVRDVHGAKVTRSLRLKLTFTPIPDLAEPALSPTPTAPPSA